MGETVDTVSQWWPALEALTINLFIAVAILAVGWAISGYLGRVVRKMAARSSRIDPTIVPMAYTVTVWAIRIVVIVAVLARLGVQTASVIAVLGAAGLAVGLALQGTLQNIAAGIMLLALRPLRAGEAVSIVGKADGTVEEVGLFLSRLKQGDGTYVTLPNSLIWGSAIINYSRNATRRLEVQVLVPYGQDIELALQELRTMVTSHQLIQQEPVPQVMVSEYRDQVLVITLRVWALAGRFGDLGVDLPQTALETLKNAGIKLPEPRPLPGS